MSNLFKVHKLNEDGMSKAKTIQIAFDSLKTLLDGLCSEATPHLLQRELTLCHEKLEEACFYAKKSMAQLVGNQE